MRQVADWLRALGLGQYGQAFAENGIDIEVLPELTDRDLEQLGIPLGHRRKMLHAITALDAAASGRREAGDASAEADMAERRQLTLLFCDIVGSTALSTRLDPEDLRLAYRAYRDGCARVVDRYDGIIAQLLGDGVLVYFGYPRAHEDDAERAVRAGLDIAAAIGWLKVPGGRQVQVRVGIATGLVVVGDLTGPGSVQKQAVVGATAHLADRLQARAKPGTVVVDAPTRKLLGEVFQLRALDDMASKDLAEPIEAWTVVSEAASESRFDTARAHGLTNFVGREPETRLIEERWQLARRGEGQVLLISGEAGIGKSRLAAWLSERIAAQPHTRLRHQCSPHQAMSAYYPIIQQLKHAAGFHADDSVAAKLDKMEAMLALSAANVMEVAPLFAALLSLPSEDRYPPLGFGAAERWRQLLVALLDQLEGLARKNPVLLVFEDVQWADANSLELIGLMSKRVARLPVLALITYRPEFEPPWDELRHIIRLTLAPLDRVSARAMIDSLSADVRLPDEVTEQILAKADGVPLFIEELTKAVLESGQTDAARRERLDGELPPLTIPVTLQNTLMARLDRFAHVKEIAEIAALIGREFPYDLLHAVAGCDRETLDDALAQLEAAQLLSHTGVPPHAHYRFQHALVQEAAYESMLKVRRQLLHRRIADTLCTRFPAVADTEPELVARHLTEAGLTDAATEWWSKAGR
jgi:class 3 adenylate cyclase